MTCFNLKASTLLLALSLSSHPSAQANTSTRSKKCASHSNKLKQPKKAYAVKLSNPNKVRAFFRNAESAILKPDKDSATKNMTLEDYTLSHVTLDTLNKVITKDYKMEAEDIGLNYYAREKFLNEELRSRKFPVADVLRYNDEDLKIYKPLIIGFTPHNLEPSPMPGASISEVINQSFANIKSVLTDAEAAALQNEIKRLKVDLMALEKDSSFRDAFQKQKLSTIEPGIFDFTGFLNNILITLDGDHLKIVIIDP